jgi:hypothetical protein
MWEGRSFFWRNFTLDSPTFRKIPATDWNGFCFRTAARSRVSGESEKRGIHMSELRNGALSQDTQATGLTFHDGSRGPELAAQANLMMARYPDYIRQQVAELLMILAAKPVQAEIGVR